MDAAKILDKHGFKPGMSTFGLEAEVRIEIKAALKAFSRKPRKKKKKKGGE